MGHVEFPGSIQAQEPGGRGRGAAANPRAVQNLFMTPRGTPETKAQNGKAVLWTREQQNNTKGHIQWAPEYRLTPSVRPPAEPGKEPSSGENHTDNTQIYLITGGSGSVLVEGTVDPANDYIVAPGEHRGGPITGGRVVKVKVGDLLSIPPDTWHIAWGDPGIPLQYLIIHIHTRNDIP
jgi:hypothetical protein